MYLLPYRPIANRAEKLLKNDFYNRRELHYELRKRGTGKTQIWTFLLVGREAYLYTVESRLEEIKSDFLKCLEIEMKDLLDKYSLSLLTYESNYIGDAYPGSFTIHDNT